MSEKNTDTAVVLNYIDKVYTSLGRAWVLENRVILSTIVLSLILLILSVGLVSPQESFSFMGVGLVVSFAGFLAGGIVMVSSLVVFFYSLGVRTTALQNELRRLYATINYEEERAAMADALTGPFQGENVVAVLLAPLLSERIRPNRQIVGLYDRIVALSVLIPITLLPFAAEATTFLKLATIVPRGQSWLLLLLAPFVLATIASPAVYLLSGRGD
jgi:hypothetical protein